MKGDGPQGQQPGHKHAGHRRQNERKCKAIGGSNKRERAEQHEAHEQNAPRRPPQPRRPDPTRCSQHHPQPDGERPHVHGRDPRRGTRHVVGVGASYIKVLQPQLEHQAQAGKPSKRPEPSQPVYGRTQLPTSPASRNRLHGPSPSTCHVLCPTGQRYSILPCKKPYYERW